MCRGVLCCAVQTADDMLCRALYALEGAWMHGFDPTTGNVRLDFENAPNRGLFLALFRHAQVRVSGWGLGCFCQPGTLQGRQCCGLRQHQAALASYGCPPGRAGHPAWPQRRGTHWQCGNVVNLLGWQMLKHTGTLLQ